MNKTIWIVLGALVIVLGGILFWPKGTKAPEVTISSGNGAVTSVACTMEAKICPDGSTVGRIGPNCEFAACPNATSTQYLKTLTAGGLTFMYPDKLPTTYIRAVDWPPKVTVGNHPLTCTSVPMVNNTSGQTQIKTINNNPYCITINSQGAAGSIYISYIYATQINNKTVTLAFTLQETQCLNYPEPKASECAAERNSFSTDQIVADIVNTIKLP